MNTARSILAATAALALLAACSSDDTDGKGTATFTSWGEEYIERQIPSSVFEDGWSVHFNKFLVVVGGIKVADDKGATAAQMAGYKLVDHTQVGVKPIVSFADLPARAWNRVSYTIAPAGSATELQGATEADKKIMVDGGFSVYVGGVATKGAASKKFAWGFTSSTTFERCRGEIGGKDTEGTVITNGGTDTIELTIHGDHLFYDDLQSPDAKVRFTALADADDRSTGNKDGIVTLEELAASPLDEIPAANGGYGTGSLSGTNDLRAFVNALSRTVGHFRGEGECFTPSK